MQFSRPCVDEREARAAAEVIGSGWLVGGAKLESFEEAFASRCEAQAAVGVSSWTTGAFLVLHALGIGPGDEVIVPSYTFIASVNVVRHAGALPIFADIDPHTFNIDPADVERKITPRTRAIIAVDQLGLPCDIDRICAVAREHDIVVLDDAACAIGSRNRGRAIGSLGDVAVFSLHARKVVTTGEGGMIVTNDKAFAARLRRLRHQGMSLSDYERHRMSPTAFESYPEVGFNFRMTDIQAAIGCVQLEKLDEMLARRREIAARYLSALKSHPLFIAPHVPNRVEPNWQSFMVALDEGARLSRNDVMQSLHVMGIPTRRGVMASHLEAPYSDVATVLPNTEKANKQNFQLPIHPGLDEESVTQVLKALDVVSETVDTARCAP